MGRCTEGVPAGEGAQAEFPQLRSGGIGPTSDAEAENIHNVIQQRSSAGWTTLYSQMAPCSLTSV